MLKNNVVKTLFVPHYENLSLQQIYDANKNKAEVTSYLPIPRETLRMPRDYVISVFYTIIGDPFKAWVKKMIDQRNAEIM